MLFLPLLLALDLRLELVRESLTGTHYRYRQYIAGEPVVGGEVEVTVRPDGSREESSHTCSGGVSPASRPLWRRKSYNTAKRLARFAGHATSRTCGHLQRT